MPATNDRWAKLYASDRRRGKPSALQRPTQRLQDDISGSLAGCSAGNSGKDAIFRFDVLPEDSPTSEVHISTFGTWFPHVVSVFDHPPIVVESEPVDPINETFETAHDLGDVSERHVAAESNTAGGGHYDMFVDYQSSLFVDSCGANTMARDAVFAFDVNSTSVPVTLEVKLDSGATHGVLSIYEEGQGLLPRWPARNAARIATGNSDASAANVYVIPSGPDDDYLTISGDTTSLGADYDATELGVTTCTPDAASMDAAFQISDCRHRAHVALRHRGVGVRHRAVAARGTTRRHGGYRVR